MGMSALRFVRRAPYRALLSGLLGLCAVPATASDEAPHLLFSAADLPRLRHRCGVGAPTGTEQGWSRHSRMAADYHALRTHFLRRPPGAALPGELVAAAFLHVIDSNDATDTTRLQLIGDALGEPLAPTADMLELVVALDWCWESLPPATRRAD